MTADRFPHISRCPPAWTLAVTLAVTLAATQACPAQKPTLLRDLNTRPAVNEGSFPGPATRLQNGQLLFSAFSADATGAERGSELFTTLGLTGSTSFVKEIHPGPVGSRPRLMVSLGAFALFAADTLNGRSLWRSDGTAAGTVKVADLPSDPFAPTLFKGKLYFYLARDLWQSDGTPAGTTLVKAFPFGFSLTRSMTVMGGTLYLTGSDAVLGAELYASDGTANGTTIVIDIVPGGGGSEVDNMLALGNRIFFTAITPALGRELWTSDGTFAGTHVVRDLDPGPGHGILTSRPHEAVPVVMAAAGSHVYFMGYTPATGLELFRSDGTTAGTTLVYDAVPGPADGMPSIMVGFGSDLLFAARSTPDFGLFRTNGTSGGTSLLRSLDAMPRLLFDGGTVVFVSVFDQTFGRELFTTDGTPAGTRLLADIHLGTASADPGTLAAAVAGRFVFAADDGVHGRELWVTDGTPARTQLLEDIRQPPPGGATIGANPGPLVAADGITFLGARGDAATGLWRTDGTTAGTLLISGLTPGGTDYPHMAALGRGLFFNAHTAAAGTELWFSDGTPGGTRIVADLAPGTASSFPREIFALDGRRVLFSALHQTAGRELWRSDGTPGGTVLVRDLWPGAADSSPGLFTRLRNGAVFTAYDGTAFRTYWTDGTTAGTVALAQHTTKPSSITAAGHDAFVYEPAFPARMWWTDGTAAQMVQSFTRNDANVATAVLGDAVFVLQDQELWKVDRNGGSRVLDLAAAAVYQQFAGNLVAAGDRLFFTAKTGSISTNVLWQSDGTPGGTAPVRTAQNGLVFTSAQLVPAGTRRICFPATDTASTPAELWISDGTPSGTFLVGDIWPGPESSDLRYLVHAQEQLLFTANDGVHGQELWQLDLGANVRRTGTGCAASGKPPRLTGNDPVLGAPLRLEVGGAAPNARGVLGVGLPYTAGAPLFPNGCSLPVDYGMPHVLLLFATGTGGGWVTTLPVPATPSLAGLTLAGQVGTDGAGTAPFGIDLSNALLLHLGQ